MVKWGCVHRDKGLWRRERDWQLTFSRLQHIDSIWFHRGSTRQTPQMRLKSNRLMHAGVDIHRHQTRRMFSHEPRELRPGQLLAENDRPVRRSPVHLEHVLCQIDAENGNLFHGCPLFQLVFQHRKLGTLRFRMGRAAPTPSLLVSHKFNLFLKDIHTFK